MLRSTIFLQQHLYQIFAPVTKGLFFYFRCPLCFYPAKLRKSEHFCHIFFAIKSRDSKNIASLFTFSYHQMLMLIISMHQKTVASLPQTFLPENFLSPMAECELHLLSFHPAPAENVYNVLWHDSIWYPFPARSPDICFLLCTSDFVLVFRFSRSFFLWYFSLFFWFFFL